MIGSHERFCFDKKIIHYFSNNHFLVGGGGTVAEWSKVVQFRDNIKIKRPKDPLYSFRRNSIKDDNIWTASPTNGQMVVGTVYSLT